MGKRRRSANKRTDPFGVAVRFTSAVSLGNGLVRSILVSTSVDYPIGTLPVDIDSARVDLVAALKGIQKLGQPQLTRNQYKRRVNRVKCLMRRKQATFDFASAACVRV